MPLINRSLRHSRGMRTRWMCLGPILSLAAIGCTAGIKPPPLPRSPSSSASAGSPDGGVVPASFVLPDGTKVHTGQCGSG